VAEEENAATVLVASAEALDLSSGDRRFVGLLLNTKTEHWTEDQLDALRRRCLFRP
jgi:hypothetical protein